MKVNNVELSKIIVEERQKRPLSNLDGLIDSINDVGLLHPIVIGTDNKLKVGYRRLTAFKQMGRPTIPAHITDNLNDVYAALKAERDENVQREPLLPTTMIDRAKELEAEERRLAQLRQEATQLQGRDQGGAPVFGSGNFPEPKETGRARDKVAAAFGLSGKTYEKAKKVKDAAEEKPDEFGDLAELMDETSVDRAHRELLKRKREKEPTQSKSSCDYQSVILYQGDMIDILSVTDKCFDLVIADPPYGVTDYDWDTLDTDRWINAIMPRLANKFNLFWFCSPRYAADIEMIFRSAGLDIQSRIVWHRRNMSMGSHAKTKFVDTWDMIFHAGNKPLNFSDVWSDAWFDVQIHAVPQTNFDDKKVHPTQKPITLIRRLVEFGSNKESLVLDPFAGGGTTGQACHDRQCVLIEREGEYCDTIELRLGIKRQF